MNQMNQTTHRFSLLLIVAASAMAFAGCGGGSDQASGTHFVNQTVVSGLSQPTAVAFAPDGRLFICEQQGKLRMFGADGAPQSEIQFSVTSNSERGLLGIALDPQFGSNAFVYLYYTTGPASLNAPATPMNRVSRLNLAAAAPLLSETILLDNIPSENGNHNGGSLRFGPDGKLYVSVGDSGNSANAQNLATLAGKILRIDSDGSIPADNPYAGQAGKRGEIYCYGLRNPYRISFRPGDGALIIADVGQNTWEEVNVGRAGANYGWPLVEGPGTANGSVAPLFAYNHNGAGASITGGAFATGSNYPAQYQNSYFFADFILGKMMRLSVNAGNTSATEADFGPAEGLSTSEFTGITDIVQGPGSDIHFLSYDTGTLHRLRFQ